MKLFKCLLLGIITFSMFGVVNAGANNIVIKGNSVFKNQLSSTKVNFISNSNGTVYYTVNENPTATENELTENSGDVMTNVTKTIEIAGSLLISEIQYVHIMVKDSFNRCSNILNIPVFNDIYYFEDFEAYKEDDYPAFFQIKFDGGNSSNQKIVHSDNNNAFKASGTYARGLDERINFGVKLSGYAVLEADILSDLDHTFDYGGLTMGADDTDTRNVIVKVTENSNRFSATNHTSNILFRVNTWNHVKIILDVFNKKFDYYIDGVKANNQPIEAQNYIRLTWFGIYNGSGNVQYDNIKFYTTQTYPNFHSITKGPETNGTFTIDKTSADRNTLITINTAPELGYRVKSVKINNSETGVRKDASNYTFNMKDEDVLVTVEFEKIEYEVTEGAGQTHTIGTTADAVFEIEADKDLFNKVYLDNEELDSAFYTVTEGSTIITLKQEFLNRLLPGTYSLKSTFTDGGEANTTFIIDALEHNPETGDSIIISMVFGSISLIGLLIIGLYLKKRNS